jgi:hypothetical protein
MPPDLPHSAARPHVKTDATALTRPPFAVLDSLDPAQVGSEMVECFTRLGKRADRLQYAHTLALSSIGLPDTDPLSRAGRAIAHDIDHGIGSGVAAGYHNGQHFLEVMLSALYLARLDRLDVQRTARVVTAGLIHDFHHDGSRGSAAPFRLERLASREAQRYLRQARVDVDECRRLETLVLATEPRAGVPFARACWTRAAAASPPRSSHLPAALERLLEEPRLAHEAVMLAEADVLPSIGLTVEHADQLQARLAAEWGTTLGRDDKRQFIDRMVGDITVAAFFVPNIEAARRAYQRAD